MSTGRKEHHRREQKQGHKAAPTNIHNPLNRGVKYIRQGHMADMDHRQSLKILHIGNRGYDIIVIRNEFGMNAGFFTDCHDLIPDLQYSLMLRVMAISSSVFGCQNAFQLVYGSQDPDILIGIS